jgi:hypothetical protein
VLDGDGFDWLQLRKRRFDAVALRVAKLVEELRQRRDDSKIRHGEGGAVLQVGDAAADVALLEDFDGLAAPSVRGRGGYRMKLQAVVERVFEIPNRRPNKRARGISFAAFLSVIMTP